MKRFLLSIILFCAFILTLNAQRTITMEKDGGVFKVPCSINGVKMKFIFDTGASTVCISLSTAKFLYDNDYIKESDFLGTSRSQVADGRIVDNLKINLRDIEIAGIHLSNVEAMVSSSLSAPLLLGQSALGKMGQYSINGNQLTIYAATNNSSSKAKFKYINNEYDADKIVEYLKDNAYNWVKRQNFNRSQEDSFYSSLENLFILLRKGGLSINYRHELHNPYGNFGNMPGKFDSNGQVVRYLDEAMTYAVNNP